MFRISLGIPYGLYIDIPRRITTFKLMIFFFYFYVFIIYIPNIFPPTYYTLKQELLCITFMLKPFLIQHLKKNKYSSSPLFVHENK